MRRSAVETTTSGWTWRAVWGMCGRAPRLRAAIHCGAGSAGDTIAARYSRIAGMVSSANWLDRYRAGQRDRIWHELRQLGSVVREPGLFEEAQLVCDEMARRARQNVEVIIERLSGAGYRFHSNEEYRLP